MASEVNKEAFVELQAQLVDTASKLKQRLPKDTRTYRSIGKAFVLDSISELMKQQEEKCQECDSSLASLQTSKEYLDREMKEVESNFKELMQQTPALARQVMAISMD